MGQERAFYRLCGLAAVSDLDLPELDPQRIEPCEPDLSFAIGPVSALPDPIHETRGLRIDRAGQVRWDVAGRGVIGVRDGRSITIEPLPGLDPVTLRAMMVGPAQALLWAQRGEVALHGSAVALGGQALCVAGPSGAGKSALTALLAETGAAVLADDIAVLGLSDDQVLLRPGYAALRLGRDIVDAIPSIRRMAPARADGSKWICATGTEAPLPDRIALSDMVLLTARAQEFAIRPASPVDLIAGWRSLVHLPHAMQAMGLIPAIRSRFAALLSQGMRVWSVTMPDSLPAARDAIPRLLGTLDAAQARVAVTM